MWTSGHSGLPGSKLTDHQAKLGAAETQHDNALEAASRRARIRLSFRPLPTKTCGWRRCTLFTLMSRSKRHLSRRNAPTWLACVMVITLLFDDGSIWWESPRKPSADCVVRNLQNTYGYDARRSSWNDTIATSAIRWTMSSAFHALL